MKNNLEAVRQGAWKLHVRKGKKEMQALYNLENDPGETENLYHAEPAVAKRLEELLEAGRQDLGDDAAGCVGQGVRPMRHSVSPDIITEVNK